MTYTHSVWSFSTAFLQTNKKKTLTYTRCTLLPRPLPPPHPSLPCKLTPRTLRDAVTLSLSLLRIRPLSTWMAMTLSGPSAALRRAVHTALSTPPLTMDCRDKGGGGERERRREGEIGREGKGRGITNAFFSPCLTYQHTP